MNDLRQAAQQALEACEQRLPLVGQATIIDELNALRAALAQPASEPVARHVFNVTVAGRLHEWEPTTFAFALRDGKHALYTAPPQRKPLTEEEITDAVRDADLDWATGWTLDETQSNRFATLARAVERAHGIKE